MKLNYLLFSALALATLVACNKEEGASTSDQREKTVTVTIRTDDVSGRATQDGFSQAGAVPLTSGTIFFTDGASEAANIVQTVILNLDAATQTQIIHNVHTNATHAILVANYAVTTTPQTVRQLMETTVGLDVVNQALSDVPLRSDVAALTDGSFDDEQHADGKQYEVSLRVKPILARIEIGGNLTVTKTEGEAFVYALLKPEAVGLNNHVPSFMLRGDAVGTAYWAGDNAVGYPEVGTPTWMYDNFMTPVELIAADGNTMAMPVSGFNVVAGTQPIVMVAFTGEPTVAADPKPAYPRTYLKIINFTDGAAVPTAIVAGNIYKIENISFNQSQLIPLDNTAVCVEVIVSVEPWTVVPVTPEFGNE